MLKRLIPVASVLSLMILTSGCLVESKIDAKGGGTMHLKYRIAKNAKLDPIKAQMTSPDVTVEKSDIDDQGYVTFDLKFADITKIGSANFFKKTAIKHVDGPDKGTKTLSATITNTNPGKIPDNLLEFYGREVKVEVTLPGEVVKTNATTHKGATATWTIPMNDFLSAKEVPLTATYKVAADAAAAKAK